MSNEEVYEGHIVDVYSGDDIIAMIDLKVENLFKRVRVRLHGVDTPNSIGSSSDSEAGRVRSYVRRALYGRPVRIEVVSKNMNSWVAVVSVERRGTYININSDLIAQGYEFKREKMNER